MMVVNTSCAVMDLGGKKNIRTVYAGVLMS